MRLHSDGMHWVETVSNIEDDGSVQEPSQVLALCERCATVPTGDELLLCEGVEYTERL